VAPAVVGVLIAVSDTAVVFALGAVGTLAMFVVLLSLHVEVVPSAVRRRVSEELGEGLRFIAGERLFLLLILLTYTGMFFGMQYVQLMPLMAEAFDVGSGRLGLLFTAIGIGAVGGTFVAMRLNRSARQGQVMLGAVFVASLFVIAFALAPSYELSLLLICGAALANSVFSISTMTALQLRVPDALRGRVMGIHGITFSLIPLGGLLGGAIAAVTDVRVALALSAAVLAVIVLTVAATQPIIRQLSSRDL
jgi:predicted MFS family arabinose efflux permease